MDLDLAFGKVIMKVTTEEKVTTEQKNITKSKHQVRG